MTQLLEKSTGDITKQDCDKLANGEWPNVLESKQGVGYLVSTNWDAPEPDSTAAYSDKFLAILDSAEDDGFDYVMFHRSQEPDGEYDESWNEDENCEA